MSEVVGEGIIRIKTDETGVDVAGSGKRAGEGYSKNFLHGIKGIATGIAATVAVYKGIDFLKESVAEARESQKVGAATNQIIKTTGGIANVTAGQVGNLATSISNKIGVDDEAIQSGENLLLTFKNVRNEAGAGNDVFNQATQAAADLSAAGFGSISSASVQLGKALNDPIKGIAALGRSGVTFSAQQQKQIKGYVAQGDLLKAQQVILKNVQGQVGGVAAASATAGEKATVAFSNIKETIGNGLLPVLDSAEAAFANKVAPAIQNLLAGTSRFSPVLRAISTGISVTVRDVGKGIGLVSGELGQLFGAGGPARAGITALLPTVVALAKAFVANLLPVLQQAATTFRTQVLPAALALGQFLVKELVPVFKQVAGIVITDVLPTFKEVAIFLYGTVYPALIGIATAVATKLQPVFVALVNYYTGSVLPTIDKLVVMFRTQLLPVLEPLIVNLLKIAKVALTFAAAVAAKVLPVVLRFAGFLIRNVLPAVLKVIIVIVKIIAFVVKLAVAIGEGIAAFHRFADNLDGVVGRAIKRVLGYVADLPKKILGLGGDLLNAGKHIGGKLLDGLQRGLKAVGGFVSGLADGIRTALNGIIDDFNNAIPNSIGAGPFSIDLPDNPIPHFARGTGFAPGGAALVGEQGAELVDLPRGARVYTAAQTRAMLAGSAAPTVSIGQLVAHDYQDFTRQVRERTQLAAFGQRRALA